MCCLFVSLHRLQRRYEYCVLNLDKILVNTSTRIMQTLNSVVLKEFDYKSIIVLSSSNKYELLQASCPQPSGVKATILTLNP